MGNWDSENNMNIVFSFDDGRSDAYHAFEILKKHGLTGSFHITTGFIDGSFSTEAFGEGRKPLKIDQLLEMAKSGMDISSHGDKHLMDEDDFSISLRKISNFCGPKEKIGFSVPNSKYSESELLTFKNKTLSRLSYIRVGRSKKCYSFWMKVCYVLYHRFHLQSSFNLFNKHNLLNEINKFEIHSLVVLSDTSSKNLISFIDKYKGTKATLVLMFHSIVDTPSNKWEYSGKDFDDICSFVSKNCTIKTLEDIANEC